MHCGQNVCREAEEGRSNNISHEPLTSFGNRRKEFSGLVALCRFVGQRQTGVRWFGHLGVKSLYYYFFGSGQRGGKNND